MSTARTATEESLRRAFRDFGREEVERSYVTLHATPPGRSVGLLRVWVAEALGWNDGKVRLPKLVPELPTAEEAGGSAAISILCRFADEAIERASAEWDGVDFDTRQEIEDRKASGRPGEWVTPDAGLPPAEGFYVCEGGIRDDGERTVIEMRPCGEVSQTGEHPREWRELVEAGLIRRYWAIPIEWPPNEVAP